MGRQDMHTCSGYSLQVWGQGGWVGRLCPPPLHALLLLHRLVPACTPLRLASLTVLPHGC